MSKLIPPEGPDADDFRLSRRALATGVIGGLAVGASTPAASTPAVSVDQALNRLKAGLQHIERSKLNAPTFDRAGKFLAFDAEEQLIAAGGTGADAGLRTDLAEPTGGSLVGLRQSGTGAVARTAQARSGEQVSVFDFIPTALQAAITAGTSTVDVTAYCQAALNAHQTVRWPEGYFKLTNRLEPRTGQTVILSPGTTIKQSVADRTIFYALSKNDLTFQCNGALLIGEGSWSAAWTDSGGHFDRAFWLIDCDRFRICDARIRNCALAGIAILGGNDGRIERPTIEGTHLYSTRLPAQANFQQGIYLPATAPYGASNRLVIDSPVLTGTAHGVLAELPATGRQPTTPPQINNAVIHGIPGQHGLYCQFAVHINGADLTDIELAGVKHQTTADNNQIVKGFTATGVVGRNVRSSLFEIAQPNGRGRLKAVKLEGVGIDVGVGISTVGAVEGEVDLIIDGCDSFVIEQGAGTGFDYRVKGDGCRNDGFVITSTRSASRFWPRVVNVRSVAGDANSACFNIASSSATVDIHEPVISAASGSFMKYGVASKMAGSVVTTHGQARIAGAATATLLEAGTISYSGWRDFSLAVTASAGRFLSVTTHKARFRVQNKTLFGSTDFTITGVGTAAGTMFVALPVKALSPGAQRGFERDVLTAAVQAWVDPANLTRIQVLHNRSSPIGPGRRFMIDFECEIE